MEPGPDPLNARAKGERRRDRRSEVRQTSILRLALIDAGGAAQLCRITNVSPQGLQATVFGSAIAGTAVTIRVPDDVTLAGTIVWVKNRCIGIKLDQPLPQSALLRFGGEAAGAAKRRRLPRIEIAATGVLRSASGTYAVEILDISPGGAMVRTPYALPALGPIVLDVSGLPKIGGQIRWLDGTRAGLLFNEAIPLQALTDWIHHLCSRMAAQVASISENDDCIKMDGCKSIAS